LITTTMTPPRKDLYESLGVERNASDEEIRKAYRRRALETHPDRLKKDATEDDIKDAAEKFRIVNNAYEVLSNKTNRELYDKVGVWPPPNVQSQEPDPFDYFDAFGYRARHHNASRPYTGYSSPFDEDPFFAGFNRKHDQFRFTDPFELFDRILFEMNNSHSHHDRHHRHHPGAFHSPMFGPSLFDSFFGPSAFGPSGFGPSPFGPSTSMTPVDPFGHFGGGTSGFSSFSTNTFNVRGGGSSNGMRSQRMEVRSQTINGVTHTVKLKIDSDGNEHEERIFPDGHKEYFYNGVAQGSEPVKLEGSSRRRRHTQDVPMIEAPVQQEQWQPHPPARTSEKRKQWWRGW